MVEAVSGTPNDAPAKVMTDIKDLNGTTRKLNTLQSIQEDDRSQNREAGWHDCSHV